MAEIEGLKELSRALKELDPRKQQRAIRNAASAAMLPVMKEARNRVPQGDRAHKTYKGRWVAPGFASRNIKRSSKTSRDKMRFTASVGVSREAFYATQFVELGTTYISAIPWLRPAYESNRKNVENLFKKKLREQIIKQAQKVTRARR